MQFAGTCCAGGVPTTATATVAAARAVTTCTDWFVRVQFPGVAPHSDAISALPATAGLHTLSATADRTLHWRRIAAAPRTRVDGAVTELRTRHRVTLTTIRAL